MIKKILSQVITAIHVAKITSSIDTVLSQCLTDHVTVTTI